MAQAGAIFAVLVALLVGVFAGYKLGELVRGNAVRYWSLNAGAVVVAMALDFVGLVTGRYWLAISAIGLMAGSLTGLKYGFSESIGVWKLFDSWTGGDEALRSPRVDERPPGTGTPNDEAHGSEPDVSHDSEADEPDASNEARE